MNKSAIRWLYGELPTLVAGGIVSQESADRIQEHYGPVEESFSRTNVAMVIISALCALLIGLGLILILAHNWDMYPRWVKTVMSLLPMVTGQALCLFAVYRFKDSRAWGEGAGTWLGLSIGSSIALISQTYHIEGSFHQFLLTWVLLGLPILYSMNAILPGILYIAGITFWCASSTTEDVSPMWYFGLLALALPYFAVRIRRSDAPIGGAFLAWTVCISLCVSLGFALEKTLPGLWIVIYSSLLAGMYLFGLRYVMEGERRGWHRAPLYIGAGGVAVMSLLLSYSWPWENIGWNHWRYGDDYSLFGGILDGVIAAFLLGTASVQFLLRLRLKRADALFIGLAPWIGLACYGIVSLSEHMELIPMLIYNVYLLVLGGSLLSVGLKMLRFSLVNAGVAILSGWIIARFLDVDMGFLVRGLVFIAVGTALLGVNIYMLKAKRKPANA
ncbi:MAG: hypothetical protein AMXMBFR84_20760 [Candidatus Hydrogenedentota bacterium]